MNQLWKHYVGPSIEALSARSGRGWRGPDHTFSGPGPNALPCAAGMFKETGGAVPDSPHLLPSTLLPRSQGRHAGPWRVRTLSPPAKRIQAPLPKGKPKMIFEHQKTSRADSTSGVLGVPTVTHNRTPSSHLHIHAEDEGARAWDP